MVTDKGFLLFPRYICYCQKPIKLEILATGLPVDVGALTVINK